MTFSAVCAPATLDAASSAAAYETTTCSPSIIIIMSAKTGKRPLRSLTAHEKLDAIRRVHDGESKASVARDIGVPESTLRGWCKNEDKISYLSRQSSPDTDESLDQVKKPKLEEAPTQPFNLSLKSTSPDLKKDGKSCSTTTERERNRAELARLSVELGLNRPEMFIPSLNNSTTQANLQDLSTNLTLLNQWNTLLMQQQKNNSIPKKVNTAPADTSTGTVSSSNNLLITTDNCDNKSKLLPKDIKQPTVQESVWYWLKTQQTMLGLNPTTNGTTPTSTSVTNTSPDQSSWFWRWYKQFAYQQLAQQQDNKPILYQQLTKETTPDQQNAENLSLKDNSTRQEQKSPEKTNKVRSVLDNLLFNNNNNDVSTNSAKEESVLSRTEAVEHGEKFLRWLETCSDPSVTAMQIMQFRTLLNNVKSVAERKNGDNVQNSKAKVKRK